MDHGVVLFDGVLENTLVTLLVPVDAYLHVQQIVDAEVQQACWRWPAMRPPGSQAKSVRTCQCLRPRRAVWALALSLPSVLSSVTGTTSAPRMRVLSRLNGWPMRSPVNASPIP